MDAKDLPSYNDLILPAVRAVASLGGSAQSAEIVDRVVADLSPTDEQLAVTFENRPHESVLLDRIRWGRSYAKLIGALESPRRSVFLLTPLGRQLLSLPENDASIRVKDLDREFRRNRPQRTGSNTIQPKASPASDDEDPDLLDLMDDEESTDKATDWRETLLGRLHQLSPDGFEEFVLYLLRLYGMELRRVGGSGDGGLDGIGTAPISPVLSSRVAVQVKRYEPSGRPVGREIVALFQRDARAHGAERAVLVTLSRFTETARQEATAMTPTIDLIDGERLADLILEQGLGVRMQPVVDPKWFDRF